MNYKIIKADNAAVLENLVNEAIGEGWQPQGGVSVIRYEISSLYASEAYEGWSQAMVKPCDGLQLNPQPTERKNQ